MPRISQLISTFSSKEASELFKKAKRVKIHPGFDILCAPTKRDFGKILIVTSSKIGKAHKRNLIRRRLKAIFYEQALYTYCIDIIIIVKKAGLEVPFEQLKTLLTNTIEKVKEKSGRKKNIP